MKTPDEIKKGLECCSYNGRCDGCPYNVTVEGAYGTEELGCDDTLQPDALAYIQQLEAERDAALDPIRGDCAYCAYLSGETIPDTCFDCANKGYYRWEFRDKHKEG